MLAPHVKPGATTEHLDKLAHDHIVNVQGAVPAPLNYAPPGYRYPSRSAPRSTIRSATASRTTGR